MRSKKKRKAQEAQLLQKIFQLQDEWTRLDKIMDQSIEPSEAGYYDLKIAEAKYFYLLREARYYHLNAN